MTRFTSYVVMSTGTHHDQGYWTGHLNRDDAEDLARDIKGAAVYRRTVTITNDDGRTETLRRIYPKEA
jgi:hypothetical protein